MARADEAEREARADRDSLKRIDTPWASSFHRTYDEHEIPYTPEAWAGIRRIAATLLEMQAKLDEFARGATPALLAQLAGGDVFKLLPKPK